MTSVILNGRIYHDGDQPPGNMGNGGHRDNLLPMLADSVADLAAKQAAAGASAAAAAASAASAVASPGSSATSTTALSIGTGSKSLAIQPGKSLTAGMSVKIADSAAPASWMAGDVIAYDSATGALAVNVVRVNGGGGASAWTVSLAGVPGQDAGVSNVTAAATGNVALTAATIGYVPVQMPGYGYAVQLPSAQLLPLGGPRVVLDNSAGEYPAGVLDGAGNCLGQVLPGESITGWLKDGSTAAGAWKFDGNLDPWWQTAEAGIAPAAGQHGLFKIDEDRSIYFSINSSNRAIAYYVAHPANGSLSVSAPQTIAASSTAYPNGRIIDLGSSRLLVQMGASWSTVDYSAAPALSFTPMPVAAPLTGVTDVLNLDNRYVVVLGAGPNAIEAVCMDCGTSGTAIVPGARVTAGFDAGGGIWLMQAHRISSASLGVLYRGTNPEQTDNQYFLNSITRTSGTALAFGVAAGALPGASGNQTWQFVQVSGPNWLLHYGKSSGSACTVLTFAATCTWGPPVDTALVSNVPVVPVKVGPNTFLLAGTQQSALARLQALSVNGTAISMGTAVVIDAAADGSASLIATSALDGRGLVNFSTGNINRYAAWSVTGTTVTIGSKLPLYQSNGHPFGADNSTYFLVERDTAQRFMGAVKSGSEHWSIAPLSIDGAGNVSLGSWQPVVSAPGMAIQPAGLTASRATLCSNVFYRPVHGVCIGGRWKTGYGMPVTASAPQQLIQSGTSALGVRVSDRRFDRTTTIYRVRFAER